MKPQTYFPHVIAILTFLAISFLYFIKPLSEGKVINMPDISNYKGGSQEIREFKEESGKIALWTNSMFGGMPSYLINRPPASKPLGIIHKSFNLNNYRPVSFIFLYLLGFYLALIAFKVNPWLSIVGAIAYAFSSYFFIIISAGHAAKVTALGYLPPIIAGVHLAYNGKKLWGSLMLGFFLALQLLVNHPQMTYYTAIIILIYGVVIFVDKLKEKQLKDFIYTSLLLVFFAAIGVGCNMGVLMPTMEYSDYSIRGKSELSLDEKNQTSGLDIDYATQWSYGIGESFTLFIPNFKGGASGGELPEGSETYKLYEKYQGKATAKKAIKRQPTYWGKQPFTAGPVYVGAIIFFLFVLGIFIVDKKYVWWLVAATVVSLIFSWGHNVLGITRFLFEYLPGYNKFRAVSSALVIAEFSIPLLAILALNKILRKDVNQDILFKSLKYALGITGGLILFFILFAKGLFDFEAISDQEYLKQQGGNMIVDALQSDRLLLLRRDAFRSLVFILLSAVIIYLFIKEKLKSNYAILGLGVLVLVDMWGVDRRYLNNDNFISKKENKNTFVKSEADKIILEDPTLDYRVLNLSVSTFNDASTSYFHKSIGGYHGAKMRRYQELIDFHISKEIQVIYGTFQTKDLGAISKSFEKTNVLNMLNTKYVIYNPKAAPLVNNKAFGNAWFVNEIKWVKDANEEIESLDKVNLETSAIIDEKFKDKIGDFVTTSDSTAKIVLEEYAPNYLKYKTSTEKDQLAVFSEIYYPHGWKIKIDGEEKEHVRADYILRSMIVPAGEHEIIFSFEPEVYKKGQMISKASAWLLILLLVGTIAYTVVLNKKD